MYQFFVESDQINGDQVIITGTDVNHIKNVLRMKVGDQLRISENEGHDYFCRIAEISDSVLLAKIQELADSTELPSKIYLFQGIPKGDRMETVIEKAVELGVYEIIPVAMKNCVVKLDEKKAASKVRKWQLLCETAAKQSKRSMIPKIHDVLSFKDAIEYACEADVRLLPYESAEGMASTKQVLSQIVPGASISIMIGPEGGFDQREIDLTENRMQIISLGKRILRTDTAGITTMSMLMLTLEMAQESQI